MKKLNIILSILLFCFISCKESPEKKSEIEKQELSKPLMDYEDLISDYDKWWSYHYNEISLVLDFEALNEKSEKISKEKFLKKLISGNFITIEVQSNDSSSTYKLFNLPKKLENGISNTIKNDSYRAFKLYKMEGNKFPDFKAVDINGIEYNNEKFKGKTTVIKTWFIACKPCIAEMPELNRLVDNYKNNNLQFLSLAQDDKEALISFLKRNEFKYDVLPNQEHLIENELNLTAYPTHLIVNKKGIIEKVFDKASGVISYIDQDYLLINDKKTNSTPPAPPAPPAPPR
ncbi:TlpA family protein disulfide reductase [Psychroflexus salinarum]|uniref:TlpA family protein disulfide reductase n=1 Tax=Psychroflexus salinarum TaxID=546024 RepID=A0ABW3GXM9_9FLAO